VETVNGTPPPHEVFSDRREEASRQARRNWVVSSPGIDGGDGHHNPGKAGSIPDAVTPLPLGYLRCQLCHVPFRPLFRYDTTCDDCERAAAEGNAEDAEQVRKDAFLRRMADRNGDNS